MRISISASFIVAVGHRYWSPAHEFHDCSVAEIQLIGKPQIGYWSKADYCLQPDGFAGQAKSQMPPSRMANDDRQTADKLARGFDSGNNICERPRPAAAWLTYSSIFQIGRDYANGRQGCAEWVRMAKALSQLV